MTCILFKREAGHRQEKLNQKQQRGLKIILEDRSDVVRN
jgi:hypothetical protein